MEHPARVTCPHCKYRFICVVPASGSYRVACLECDRIISFSFVAPARWVYRRFAPPFRGLVLG